MSRKPKTQDKGRQMARGTKVRNQAIEIKKIANQLVGLADNIRELSLETDESSLKSNLIQNYVNIGIMPEDADAQIEALSKTHLEKKIKALRALIKDLAKIGNIDRKDPLDEIIDEFDDVGPITLNDPTIKSLKYHLSRFDDDATIVFHTTDADGNYIDRELCIGANFEDQIEKNRVLVFAGQKIKAGE